jgi:hypothetical protein
MPRRIASGVFPLAVNKEEFHVVVASACAVKVYTIAPRLLPSTVDEVPGVRAVIVAIVYLHNARRGGAYLLEDTILPAPIPAFMSEYAMSGRRNGNVLGKHAVTEYDAISIKGINPLFGSYGGIFLKVYAFNEIMANSVSGSVCTLYAYH